MNITNEEKAMNLFQSVRGQYIIGQALCIAIEQLESVEPEHLQQKSNIQDMKLLAKELFFMGAMMHSMSGKDLEVLTEIAEEELRIAEEEFAKANN